MTKFLYSNLLERCPSILSIGRTCLILTMLVIAPGMVLFAQDPVINVRFANPQFDCATSQYCVDVEFQSDTPDQEIFGMNVRFFYNDAEMEFLDFRNFQGGYAPFFPDPPQVTTGGPNSGMDLFGFPAGEPSEFVNGSIILDNPAAGDLVVPTAGWISLFQVCFTVNVPNVDENNFCPSIVWDLEANPANGGFLVGDDGVVITLEDQSGMVASLPASENVVQYNWEYSGPGTPPYGNPVENTCIAFGCAPVANCLAPTNLGATNITGDAVTVTWTSNNLPIDDHCWRILIGGQGFTNVGQAVVDVVVCAGPNNGPSPGLTINGNMVSVDIMGGALAPGTCYDYYVTETCNGLAGGNASPFAGPFPFCTFDDQFTAEANNIVVPTCPGGTDGSFCIDITDGPSCTGTTYDIAFVSGPVTPNPTVVLGATDAGGNYCFTGAAVGTYTYTVTETGACNPPNDVVTVTVIVGPGVDVTDPIIYLTDIFGNVLADTDPATGIGSTLALGDVILPEGTCGRQDEFYVYGTDNCDIFIDAPGAFTATATTLPASLVPGTQVTSPLVDDPFSINYLLDVHWSAGQSTVVVTGADMAGNTASITLTANVIADEDDLAIVADPISVVVPVCEDEVTVLFGVTITGGCDATLTGNPTVTLFGSQLSNLQLVFVDLSSNYFEYAVTVAAPATPLSDFITISYTSALGTTESTSIGVTATAASENLDPVIYANAEDYSIPACQATANVIYSFTVCDDCEPVIPGNITFTSGAGLTPFFTDNVGNNCVYVEYSGQVAPGTYFPSITYGPTSVLPSLVVTQDAPQDPVIDMPGNLNFTVPVCQTEIDQIISLTVSDDCDVFASTDGINVDGLTLTLGGNTITPSYFDLNGNSVYVEYTVTLSAANSGQLLVANYGGVTVDAQIVVTDQPDNWAPIIIYPSQDINVELDPCESNIATVIFEVTATDNCDGDLANDNVEVLVTVNPPFAGGIIIPSPGGDTYFGFFEANESYQVLIEATDAAGNTRQEDFFVNVTQDAAASPNLACNDDINITLNDNCQAEILPSMVLVGEFGCLVADDFDITVVDQDPSNGTTVDGCGEFPVNVTLAVPPPVQGFVGPFAAVEWMVTQDPPTSAADLDWSTVEFTSTTLTLQTLAAGPSDGSDFDATGIDAIAAAVMPADGNVSFDYDYNGFDSGWDWFVIDVDGNIIAQGNVQASGSVDVDVAQGQILLIGIEDDGLLPVGGNTPSILEITNFVFTYASGVDAGAFTQCWGYITAEDKDDPVLDCPDDTDMAFFSVDVQTLDGTIDGTDPTIQALQYPCFYEVLSYQNPGANDVEDEFSYDLFTFTVTQSDYYTFFFESDDFTGANGGAMALLFQGGFDAGEPCSNVIFQNDQQVATGAIVLFPSTQFGAFYTDFNPLIRISLPLEAGQTYTLLTTGTFATTMGDYTWNIFSDGNGVVQGPGISTPQTSTALVELVCDDILELTLSTLPANVPRCYKTDADGNVIYPTNFQERQRLQQLLDLLAKTGYPVNGDPFDGFVSDNCGDITVCVTDVVNMDPNCAPNTITRTFTAVDEKGNEADACSQVISARKLTVADVMVPPLTAFVECDEGDFEANNPSPAITGWPFVQTATGFVNLGVAGAQEYCNLAAQYSDQPRIEVCPSAYKFIRSWNVLNWCNPIESQIFVQIIKVGDFSAPEVTCPEVDYDWDGIPDILTYSTGPFNCTAAFAIPAPTVTDNCSDYEVSTEVVTTVQDTIYDQWGINIVDIVDVDVVVVTVGPNQPQFVSGIPLGCHRFRYTVTDDCGNIAVIECPFQVEDQVEPIAVCDDDLNISIGGQGYARVYAADIDEGSSDNCGPIRIEVRRLYSEDATTCNPIPPFYSPWGDYVDFNCCDVNDMVTIELRVWDDRNGDGIAGNTIPVMYCDGSTKLVTDNSNVCWLEVLVEDKIRPFCAPPHAVVRDCNDLPYNFSATDTLLLQELFGNAMATDNCPGAYTQELPPIDNLDDCGFGTIIRRFRAIDAQGNVSTNSCQQIITINEVHEYEIKFPKDAEAFCGEPNPDTIAYEEIGCDLLAVEITDDTLSASGDECYKIFRHFQVVNWCEYDGISQAVTVSRDEDCDGQPGDEDVWVLVRPNGITYFDRDNNEANNNPFAFTKGTSCDGITNPTGHWINSTIDVNATRDPITGVVQQGAEPIPNIRDIASRGYWKYEQHIRVYDNVDPIITVDPYDAFCSEDGVNCTGDVEITFVVDENCTPDDIEVIIYLDVDADGSIDFNSDDNPSVVSLSGSYPNFTISGTYPIGDHEFGIRVDDGCGNYSSADVPFTVVDCKAPAPVCINGLAIELMPQPAGTDADGDGDEDCAAMAIWANDFIASPIYDCTGQGDQHPTNENVTEILKYSIHRADSVIAGSELPDPSVTGLVATCDDPATLIVRIYAWDDADNPYSVQPDGSVGGPNYDFCETYILVQDNMGSCEGDECGGVGSRIAGVIMTEEDETVEGVAVGLSGQTEMDMTTASNGQYEFSNLESGYDYTVTPELDLDHLNGVTTFDLVLISKHILGVTPLDSPYKLIAADANNSHSISTIDIIKIRKLILNIDTEFEDNTSWRFVDAAYVFPDPSNPWSEVFPEVINYNNLTVEQLNQDFVGVKIGDVNGSVQANFASLDDRTTNGLFAFELQDEQLAANQTYQLDFRAKDMNQIQGYQLTLTFDADKVEYVGMDEKIMTEAHIGLRHLDQGMITMSWNGEAGQVESLTDQDVLFGLQFRANTATRWSEVLGVSSRYTMAEAYNAGNQLLEVGLHFNEGPTVVQAFELYQNRPNPFRESTVIGFYLPQATEATLSIQDINGRTIKLIRNDFAKGYNEVVVKSGDLPKGMLYYTLETDDYNATRKMILIE